MIALSLVLLACNIYQQPNPSVPPTKSSIQERNADKKAKDPDARAHKDTLPTISALNSDEKAPATTQIQQNTGPSTQGRLYRAYLWAQTLAPAIALLGIAVLIWQNVLLQRTAKAAEQSANAAKANSDAFIDTEASILSADNIQLINFPAPYFSYYVGVSGKTTCTILFESSQMQIGESKESPPDISVYGKSQTNQMAVEQIVSPDAAMPAIFAGYLVGHRPFEDGEWKAVQEGKKFMWACGVFRYRDAFRRRWERRYCSLWDPNPAGPHFCVGGPAEYNRLTKYRSKSQKTA